MPAASTDKFIKVGSPGTATTLSAPGYTAGATSITVGSTSNWPTDTGVIFAIDEAEVVNGEEVQVAGTYNEFEGTVASGTSVTGVDWKVGVGDRNYSPGALTRVYVPVSAERENRLIDGILVHADQDGTLRAGAVDNAAVLASDVVETIKVKDKNITLPKINGGTTAGLLKTDTSGNVTASTFLSGSFHMNTMTFGTWVGNNARYKDIVFGVTLPAPPAVLASVWNYDTASYGAIITAVTSVTTTGCRIWVNADINTNVVGVYWMAV